MMQMRKPARMARSARMAPMVPKAALLAALLLAACQPAPSDYSGGGTGQVLKGDAVPRAQTPRESAHALAEAPDPVSALPGRAYALGSWLARPLTPDAEALTGDVVLEGSAITAARGVSYRTRVLTLVGADTEISPAAGRFADAMGLTDEPVEIRRVSRALEGGQPDDGLFCGAQTATHLALAMVRGPDRRPGALVLAAFTGTLAPGIAGSDARLCGAWRYSVPKPRL